MMGRRQVERIVVDVVPAPPGCFLIHEDKDTGELYATEHVIAWRIVTEVYARHEYDVEHPEPFTSAQPVSAEGVPDDSNFWGVQYADGSAHQPYCEYHPTLQVASESNMRRHAERAAERTLREAAKAEKDGSDLV